MAITGTTTVSVSGTVTTVAAGTSSTPKARIRASSASGTSLSTGTVTIPAATQVGDLLVLLVTFGSGVGVTSPSGWTRVYTLFSGPFLFVFTKTATSADAGASQVVQFNTTANGSLMVFAVDNATTLAMASSGTVSSGVPGSLSSGVVSTGDLMLGATIATGTNAVSGAQWAWGNAAQGGPDNPPDWAQVLIAGNEGIAAAVSSVNWSDAEAYIAAPTLTSGSGSSALFILS